MKTLSHIRILLVSLSIFLFGNGQQAAAQPGISISFQQFYDELSPYGEWVNDPQYGYIWVPNVSPDFQPYATNGQWVMTDYGNTWVSNYQWGWAPFHYGRWHHHTRFGWTWVPGYEWGPAWVSWRSGGGYYGWAPLGPGVNIQVNVGIPANFWIFVPQRYLLSPSIHRYYAPRRNVVNVYQHTTVIHNTYVYNNRTYVSGPRRTDIERITRSRVDVHRISDAGRPGAGRLTNKSVEIYRPQISRNNQARPTRVSPATSIRPNTTTRNNSRVSTTVTPNNNRTSPTRNVNRTSATTSRTGPSKQTAPQSRERFPATASQQHSPARTVTRPAVSQNRSNATPNSSNRNRPVASTTPTRIERPRSESNVRSTSVRTNNSRAQGNRPERSRNR